MAALVGEVAPLPAHGRADPRPPRRGGLGRASSHRMRRGPSSDGRRDVRVRGRPRARRRRADRHALRRRRRVRRPRPHPRPRACARCATTTTPPPARRRGGRRGRGRSATRGCRASGCARARSRPVAPSARTGSSTGSSTRPWSGFDLAGALGTRLGFPVFADNDANLARARRALARASPGTTSTFAWCILGNRAGVGIVIRGAVHRGFQGAAGEIVEAGAIDRVDRGRTPLALLTSPVAAERAARHGGRGRGGRGDEAALAQVDEFAEHIAELLSTTRPGRSRRRSSSSAAGWRTPPTSSCRGSPARCGRSARPPSSCAPRRSARTPARRRRQARPRPHGHRAVRPDRATDRDLTRIHHIVERVRTVETDPRSADVLIVGSGIMGAAVARLLRDADPDLRIVMVDARARRRRHAGTAPARRPGPRALGPVQRAGRASASRACTRARPSRPTSPATLRSVEPGMFHALGSRRGRRRRCRPRRRLERGRHGCALDGRDPVARRRRGVRPRRPRTSGTPT